MLGGLDARTWPRHLWRLLAVTPAIAALLAHGVPLGVVAAEPAPSEQTPPEPAPEPAAPAAEAAPAAIEGFRGARFGMTEAQVRDAIRKDFPAAPAKLRSAVHPSEKTTVLTLPVTDLLPHSGVAQASYILGYASKKLVQVNLVWRSNGGDSDDEAIVGTANALRDYFTPQKYEPGSTLANRQLGEHAIIVFRGADVQGHMVLAVLSGAAAAARKAEKPPRTPPLTLELSYIGDPAHPDIFRIGKGQF